MPQQLLVIDFINPDHMKLKKFFQSKLIKKFVGPTARALLKQVPIIGTPIAEVLTNLSQPKDAPKKHSTLSMVIQWLSVAAIAFAFWKKWITVTQLLSLFGVDF